MQGSALTITDAPDHIIIDGRAFAFTSYAEVSAAYRATIDRLGIGGSETPPCRIFKADGQQVAYVSYNGRVWPGSARDWQPGRSCIYDPLNGGRFPVRMVAA